MVIILDTPFSLGDLATETFPHVYVTNLNVNGPAQTVMVMWEVGKVQDNGSWQPTPANTSVQFNLTGEALLPFFTALPKDMETNLWDQVETMVYEQIMEKYPRYVGKLGSGVETASTATATQAAPADTTEAVPLTAANPLPQNSVTQDVTQSAVATDSSATSTGAPNA